MDTVYDHFSKRKILLFSLPTIGSLIVYNLYTMVDGFFISNYIGTDSFAAENIIFPVIMLALCFGSMFGVGGNALISHILGENDTEAANRCFTQTVVSLAVVTSVIGLLLFIFMPQLSMLAGSSKDTLASCVLYGRVLSVFIPFGAMFFAFQSLLVTSGKASYGFKLMLFSAAVNFVLDYLLVAVIKTGIVGGAIGTAAGWAACTIPAFLFFCRPDSRLHFIRFHLNTAQLKQTVWNGLSEMVDSASVTIVSILYNRVLIQFFEEEGIATASVASYVSSVFLSVSMGISLSMTGAIAYYAGKGDRKEVLRLRKNGIQLILMLGAGMFLLCRLLAQPSAELFVGHDPLVLPMAVHALKIFSFAFLISGLTIFGAGFYSGLNDGLGSMIIAGAKALLFPALLIGICKKLSLAEGLWYVTPISELLTLILVLLLFHFRTGSLPADKDTVPSEEGTSR